MRVLIVDDESMLVSTLRRLLALDGHTVSAACDAAEALRLLEGGAAFDAIVCDMCMPDVGGAEFLTRVPAIYRDRVVLMSGGFEAANDAQTARERRLAKPFTVDELYAAIGCA